MATEYGNRLRQARKYAGLTQEQLGEKTGIAQSTISSAEREGHGSAETPAYAAACGVNAIWLAKGEGPMTPIPQAVLDMDQATTEGRATSVPAGTAKIIKPVQVAALAPVVQVQLTRFLRVIHRLPQAAQQQVLASAIEAALDLLPEPPTAGQ